LLRGSGTDLRRDSCNDCRSQLVLDLGHAMHVPVVTLGPQMIPGGRVNKLHGDANASADCSHAPLEDVLRLQRLPHEIHLDRPIAILKGRAARDDEEAMKAGQLRDDVFSESVAEACQPRIGTHVDEWQQSDRRFLRRIN
jgi:hypothetical protein